MKSVSLLLMLSTFVAAPAAAQFQGAPGKTFAIPAEPVELTPVSVAKTLPPGKVVNMQGRIIEQVGEGEYTFAEGIDPAKDIDSANLVRLNVENQMLRDIPVNTDTPIKLSGTINIDDGRTEVDVHHIDTISPMQP